MFDLELLDLESDRDLDGTSLKSSMAVEYTKQCRLIPINGQNR